MQILRISVIWLMICGLILPAYADGLPANPWGKDTNLDAAEPARQNAEPLKANPWKDPQASHVVHFSDSADSAPEAPQTTPNMVISARPSVASGTMSHTKSPIRIISRSELNGGYNTFVNPNNDDDFSAMWKDLMPSDNAASGSSNANTDFDILPDFGKIKRDSVRKFNNVTAPVRKMGGEAKEYFEKGSGIKLDNLF